MVHKTKKWRPKLTLPDLNTLAKVVTSGEVSVVQSPEGHCHTDGKVITIPELPASITSKETLGLVRTFECHELAHIKCGTDMEVYQKYARRSDAHGGMLNALEDVRIEAAMVELYPGVAESFKMGHRVVSERNDKAMAEEIAKRGRCPMSPHSQLAYAVVSSVGEGATKPEWMMDEAWEVATDPQFKVKDIPSWAKSTKDLIPTANAMLRAFGHELKETEDERDKQRQAGKDEQGGDTGGEGDGQGDRDGADGDDGQGDGEAGQGSEQGGGEGGSGDEADDGSGEGDGGSGEDGSDGQDGGKDGEGEGGEGEGDVDPTKKPKHGRAGTHISVATVGEDAHRGRTVCRAGHNVRSFDDMLKDAVVASVNADAGTDGDRDVEKPDIHSCGYNSKEHKIAQAIQSMDAENSQSARKYADVAMEAGNMDGTFVFHRSIKSFINAMGVAEHAHHSCSYGRLLSHLMVKDNPGMREQVQLADKLPTREVDKEIRTVRNPHGADDVQYAVSTVETLRRQVLRTVGSDRHALRAALSCRGVDYYVNDQRRGRINPKALAGFAAGVNDKPMRQRVVVPDAPAAVTILLDGSGSMSLPDDTGKAAYFAAVGAGCVAQAIGGTRIRSRIVSWNRGGSTFQVKGSACDVMHGFEIKGWNDNVTSPLFWELLYAYSRLPLSNTPLDRALLAVGRDLLAQRNKKKRIICLTDGGNDFGGKPMVYALKALRANGIEVFFVTLMDGSPYAFASKKRIHYVESHEDLSTGLLSAAADALA